MRAVGDGLVLRPGIRFWLAAGIAIALAGLTACSGPRDATGEASTSGTVRNRTEIQVVTPRSVQTIASTVTVAPPSRAATARSVPSTTTATTTAVATTAVATTVAAATTPYAVPTCAPADLEVAIDIQPHGGIQPADRTRGLVVVTDLSAQACQLAGFAAIDAVEGGRRTPIAVGHVEQPGPPTAVEVAGGGSAFAGVEWTATTGCPDVSALRLALPGGGRALPVDVVVPGGADQSLVVCSAGVLVGPFAATSEGTVAFPDTVGAGT